MKGVIRAYYHNNCLFKMSAPTVYPVAMHGKLLD